MCGVAGIVSRKVTHQHIGQVKDLTTAIVHRGPDASGYWNDKRVALGHRRLSIVDLKSTADQPMVSACGHAVLVFNGEIYNHNELKRKLIANHTFITDHSDTEVLLNAYLEWGIDCLRYLEGMFAFCIYDLRTGDAYLCRDPLGEKPLFYSLKNEEIAFCSEAAPLANFYLSKKVVSAEAIYDYLSYLTSPAPNSFFEGVSKLEAGHYLKIVNGVSSKHRYWNIADHLSTVDYESQPLSKLASSFGNIYEEAVQRIVSADVPIAVALSGGLDSSMNLYHASRFAKNGLMAINVAYDRTSGFDESKVARKFANEMGVDFHGVTIGEEDFQQWITKYISIHSDMPVGDPNGALLSGMAEYCQNHGFKVMLVGEGGDELGGYPVYQKLLKLNRLRWVLNTAAPLLAKSTNFTSFGKDFDVMSRGGIAARRFLFAMADAEKESVWQRGPMESSFRKLKKVAAEVKFAGGDDAFIRRLLNVEYRVRHADLLLPRVDYPLMAHSVEGRSPFMNRRLVELCARVPVHLKMQDGPKTILKEYAKGILPSYLIGQPKVGFGQLLTPFLSHGVAEWFRVECIKQDAPITQYLSHRYLKGLYERHLASRRYGYQLWVLYALNRWLALHGQ